MSEEEKKKYEELKKLLYNGNLSQYGKRQLIDIIEKQQKELEQEKEKNENLNWYFENQKQNFIHKDKIKAKIEEKRKRIDQMHPASDCVIIDDLKNEIEVLEELLEE